ncbi:uncharacterized protein [Triticum aestivum]|uniref:uncharacterized protein isoform X2 n=1 Tax=Triticum aestivum TaxID=4565 RepID=UPI001D01B88D|nr:uncharacterized protein LOC123172625 isoform X2 [Triticum aestivum]
MRAGSVVDGGSPPGAAGARRTIWFRYLTALLNLLGFEQQLSLGQDRHIIWIMNLQDGFPRHNHCNHPAFPRQACIGAGYASCNSTSTGRQEQEDGHDFCQAVEDNVN